MDIQIDISGDEEQGFRGELSSRGSRVSKPAFTEITLAQDGSVRLVKPTSAGSLILEGRLGAAEITGVMRQGQIRAPFSLHRNELLP